MRSSCATLAVVAGLCLFCVQARADDIDFEDLRLSQPDQPNPGNLVVLELPQPGKPIDIPVPSDKMFKDLVGRGYDPIKQKISAYTCVADAGNDDKVGFGKLEGVTFHSKTTSVSSIEDKEKASTSQVSFGFAIKSFGLGASASGSHGDFFNSVDSFGSLYSLAITQEQERARGKWDPKAEKYLHNDLNAFLDHCGTMYVEAIHLGHVLNDTIHFSTTATGSIKESAAALKVSVAKLFSVGGGTASNEKDTQSNSTSFNLIEGKGVFGIPSVPTDKEGDLIKILEYADTGFAAAVKSDTNNQQAVPLYITVAPYKVDLDLADRNLVPTWTFDVEQVFVENLKLFTRLQAAVSELDFATSPTMSAHFSELYDGTVDQAKAKLAKANGLFDAMKGASDACEKILKASYKKDAADDCRKQFTDAIDETKVGDVEIHRKQ